MKHARDKARPDDTDASYSSELSIIIGFSSKLHAGSAGSQSRSCCWGRPLHGP